MKALIFKKPGDISLERSYPEPIFNGEGAVIKVKYSALCATDIKIFQKGHFKIKEGDRRILGHEIYGEVVEIQKDFKKPIPIHSKVFIAPNIGCGKCIYCLTGKYNLCPEYDAFGITLDGAFAEYMYVPKRALEQGNVIPIEREIDEELIPLVEPLSTCLYNLDNLRLIIGDIVLVMGAGFMGLLNAIIAKFIGASLVAISDIRDDRLELAKKLDIDYTINSHEENLEEKVREITRGEKFNIVIVAVPDPKVQEEAIKFASRLGKISFFAGLSKEEPYPYLNTNLIHYNQLIITGTTGADVNFYRRALRLILFRKEIQKILKTIITLFSLMDIERAFEKQLKGEILKAVISNDK